MTPIVILYVYDPAADPLNPALSDPTNPIVTSLALTDVNGNDLDGSLGALAGEWSHPEFGMSVTLLNARDRLGWGGYPTSRPMLPKPDLVEQVFVDGRLNGRPVAYRLSWNPSTGAIIPTIVTSVVFNELGDYTLSGEFLEAYMRNGGYAKFGAPISNAHETTWNGKRALRQDFAKGWSLIQELPGTPTPPPAKPSGLLPVSPHQTPFGAGSTWHMSHLWQSLAGLREVTLRVASTLAGVVTAFLAALRRAPAEIAVGFMVLGLLLGLAVTTLSSGSFSPMGSRDRSQGNDGGRKRSAPRGRRDAFYPTWFWIARRMPRDLACIVLRTVGNWIDVIGKGLLWRWPLSRAPPR